MADQLWFMTRIWEEENSEVVSLVRKYLGIILCELLLPKFWINLIADVFSCWIRNVQNFWLNEC